MERRGRLPSFVVEDSVVGMDSGVGWRHERPARALFAALLPVPATYRLAGDAATKLCLLLGFGTIRKEDACHFPERTAMDRRQFLVASASGLAGLQLGNPALVHGAEQVGLPTNTRKAKSTILFFLCGGASHMQLLVS